MIGESVKDYQIYIESEDNEPKENEEKRILTRRKHKFDIDELQEIDKSKLIDDGVVIISIPNKNKYLKVKPKTTIIDI